MIIQMILSLIQQMAQIYKESQTLEDNFILNSDSIAQNMNYS